MGRRAGALLGVEGRARRPVHAALLRRGGHAEERQLRQAAHQAWASTVFESDAVVVVTPQYNRSFPAPIKNAIDYLFAEWDRKPVALVGYGWTGAGDATADLAKVLGHVKADVVGSTGLVFTEDVTPDGDLTVGEDRSAELSALLDALASRVDDPAAVTA